MTARTFSASPWVNVLGQKLHIGRMRRPEIAASAYPDRNTLQIPACVACSPAPARHERHHESYQQLRQRFAAQVIAVAFDALSPLPPWEYARHFEYSRVTSTRSPFPLRRRVVGDVRSCQA